MERKLRGFWTASGHSVSCGADGNLPARDDDVKALAAQLTALYDSLAEVEGLIQQTTRALRLSQPPMYGKYDVRWWKERGVRKPVLVRWSADADGSMTPKPVRRVVDIRTDRAFAVNCAETIVLLQMVREQLAMRARLLATIGKLKQVIAAQHGVPAWILEQRSKVAELQRRVVTNLVERGYSVEPAVLQEAGLEQPRAQDGG